MGMRVYARFRRGHRIGRATGTRCSRLCRGFAAHPLCRGQSDFKFKTGKSIVDDLTAGMLGIRLTWTGIDNGVGAVPQDGDLPGANLLYQHPLQPVGRFRPQQAGRLVFKKERLKLRIETCIKLEQGPVAKTLALTQGAPCGIWFDNQTFAHDGN